jgi:hypothetical protein
MDRAYLAIIDRRGLRALLPEDEDGYRAAVELAQVLGPAACYWATLSTGDALDVCRELVSRDFPSACREVWQRAAHLGPVCRRTPELQDDC